MSKVLEQFVKETYTSRQVPDFRVGDIVKVHQIVPDIKVQKKLSKTAKAIKKTQEKDKVVGKRVQVFEGIVIAKKHGREPGASFTVRKIASHNVGVEKIFPLYSPLVKKIEVVSRPGKVRRSKLYFLRDRVGKKARRLGVGTAVEQEVTSVEETQTKTDDTQNDEDETLKDQKNKVIDEAPTPGSDVKSEEQGRGPDSSNDVGKEKGEEKDEENKKEE